MLSLSPVTYSSCIRACEQGSNWQLAVKFLGDMKGNQTAAGARDEIAYSTAISACGKSAAWAAALELFAAPRRKILTHMELVDHIP